MIGPDLLFIAGVLCGVVAVLMVGWTMGREYERSCRPPGRVVVVRDLHRDEIAQRRAARQSARRPA